MKEAQVKARVAAMVFVAGIMPLLASLAANYFLGAAARVNEPVHLFFEVAGSCIAVGVALLLLLQARYEDGAEHLVRRSNGAAGFTRKTRRA